MASESDNNLSLWRSVEKTDPQQTKQFSGKGGFKGTAISPMWLIKRATERWGPMGGAWGIRVLSDRVLDGPGQEKLHVVLAEVFHPGGSIPCFGQTTLCGLRKDGTPYLDEEAPKKSLTDALTKGLSWLGFAADVHMGLFDDCKYVNQVRDEFTEKKKTDSDNELRLKALKVLAPIAQQGTEALRVAYKAMNQAMRDSIKGDVEGLKQTAKEADEGKGEAMEVSHA